MLAYPLVSLGRNNENAGVAGSHLLDVAHNFLIDVRGRCDSNQWNLGIEQGDRAVLEFACWETFGVDVGDLFELERSLQCCGIADTASNEHDAAQSRELFCQR